MTTATTNLLSQRNDSPIALPALLSLVSALFGLGLRESLNADSTGNQADAAYHWGM